MRSIHVVVSSSLAAFALLAGSLAPYDASAELAVRPGRSTHHEITVTNVTQGQSFTPILAVSHEDGVSMFSAGSPASPELAALAEGGDTTPLAAALETGGGVRDVATTEGLLGPGESTSLMLRSSRRAGYVSLAAMLIPTNDAFVALNGVKLPRSGVTTYRVGAYDAGTEPNTEDCAEIPGPVCGGEGGSPGAGGEGFVHVHNGIHGIADLSASVYDWRNPVAIVRIEAR